MFHHHRLSYATPVGRLGETGRARPPPATEVAMTRLRWDRISILAVNLALWGMIFILVWKLVK